MTAIRWAILALYLVGWLVDARPALRRRMLVTVCCKCDRSQDAHKGVWWGHQPEYAVRGAVRERTGRDAAVAIWNAAWWPMRLLVIWCARLLWLVGDGVSAAVLSGRPTAPELERRIREQSAEIARLTKEIDEGKGS